MYMCDNNHEEIVYTSVKCPVCYWENKAEELKNETEDLKDEVDNLEGQISDLEHKIKMVEEG